MEIDGEPAILGLAYCSFDELAKFDDEMKKRGYRYRVLLPIDLHVTLGKEYDKQINFFKQWFSGISERLLNIPFASQIFKALEKTTGYRKLELKWNWKRDNNHRLSNMNFTPLFREYKEGYKKFLENDDERKNYERLTELDSDGYKEDEQKLMDKIDEEMKK